MLYENFYYKVFIRYSAGKIWSSKFLYQISLTGTSDENNYSYVQNIETHWEPSQTSKINLLANTVIAWKRLTIFSKSSILDNLLGSRYTSAISKVTLRKCAKKGKHLL